MWRIALAGALDDKRHFQRYKVAVALSEFGSFEDGSGARPTIAKLAAMARVSRSTVIRSIAWLRANGWIEFERFHETESGGKVPVYRLASPGAQSSTLGDTPPSVTQGDTQPCSATTLEETTDACLGTTPLYVVVKHQGGRDDLADFDYTEFREFEDVSEPTRKD